MDSIDVASAADTQAEDAPPPDEVGRLIAEHYCYLQSLVNPGV